MWIDRERFARLGPQSRRTAFAEVSTPQEPAIRVPWPALQTAGRERPVQNGKQPAMALRPTLALDPEVTVGPRRRMAALQRERSVSNAPCIHGLCRIAVIAVIHSSDANDGLRLIAGKQWQPVERRERRTSPDAQQRLLQGLNLQSPGQVPVVEPRVPDWPSGTVEHW